MVARNVSSEDGVGAEDKPEFGVGSSAGMVFVGGLALKLFAWGGIVNHDAIAYAERPEDEREFARM